jgi:type I restriction enzyme S subunit
MVKGWVDKKFGELGSFYKGGGISMRDTVPTGYPCIMYGDIYVKFNTHFKKADYKITIATANKSVRAKPGDLFFTASGETAEEIGKCVCYRGDTDLFIGGDIIALTPFSEYNSLFLAYVQNSEYVIKQKATFGQGHTVVHINADNIKNIDVTVPVDTTEQAEIAEVLSDMDEYIQSLERLIAKKKDIKKGAMQTLLTGKVRLQGFTGEWVETNLGKCCLITTGRKDVNEGNELGKYPLFTCSRDISHTDTYSFDTKAILVAGNGDVGNLHYYSGKFEAYQRTYVLYDFSIQIDFLWQFLNYSLIETLGVGKIGSSIPYIKRENLTDFIVKVPFSCKEQTAIAEILSDMDNEIDALTAKLDKARLVKQGAMQQLLTGKIRLVEGTAEEQTVSVAANATNLAHNKEFEDAVIIGAIVNGFYNPQYPLGRVKVTKLRYLLDRKRGADISSYMEKAAGPYDPSVRYSGGEAVAKRSGYITVTEKSGKGAIFASGAKVTGIQTYIDKWGIRTALEWLVKGFKFWKTEDLEVLATVDNARLKIEAQGQTATVPNIVAYIENSDEWKAKRGRESFADDVIEAALKQSRELFDGKKEGN